MCWTSGVRSDVNRPTAEEEEEEKRFVGVWGALHQEIYVTERGENGM